jgi:hypothetical protein
MVGNKIRDEALPGWTFSLEEVSNGYWRAQGRHDDGRSVGRMGSDEIKLLSECMEDPRLLPER